MTDTVFCARLLWMAPCIGAALMIAACASRETDFVQTMNYSPGAVDSNVSITSVFTTPDTLNR